MSLRSVKTLGLIFSLKAKAHHSPLISNLHKQGYGEVKLHVILVIMGTIHKDHTDKLLADLNLDYHKP